MASPYWYRSETALCNGGDEFSFQKESTSEKPHMKSKPSLRDLLRELDTVNNWQVLMINLGVEKHENDKIEINFPNDVDRQKQEAFDKWLRMKLDACWRDVIDGLYEMKEVVLAQNLEKKYDWRDPRVSVRSTLLSAASDVLITANPLGDTPFRKFLPPLVGKEYHTLESGPVQINESSAAYRTEHFVRLIQHLPPHNLYSFLKRTQDCDCKADFKVGLEVRFGHVYYKMDPKRHFPQNSTRHEWIKSKLLQRATFQPEIDEGDLSKLFEGRQKLGKKVTRLSLKFTVEGQGEGTYSAVVSTIDDGDQFFLDAVYRQTALEKTVRIDIALPGLKYDFRISECCECILLAEHQNSIPYQMATTIVKSLCRLPNRKLCVILRGQSQNKKAKWKVHYIRQRVQRQYEWKPERRWILAQYNVDIFDCNTNESVNMDTVLLNERVDILEFDCSRNEVELWGRRIYHKDVNSTHPSRNKYYYMEGIHGVRLPNEQPRDPCDWTAEDLLSDFEEFLGDAFKIAHILDGSPY